MEKVIGYLRVSTDEQGKSGLGLADQKAKIEAYASLYDLEIISIYEDHKSGKNLNRDGLKAAIADIKAGKADGLIIAKLDRLSRSVKDMGHLLETAFQTASLHCVSEQINTQTAAGKLVLNVLTSVAQWERETIGERTTAALQQKKARGEKTGGTVPFGFDVTADGTLIENADEQAVIRMIHGLRDKGYSYQRVADELNKDGITTKTGRSWSWQTARKAA